MPKWAILKLTYCVIFFIILSCNVKLLNRINYRIIGMNVEQPFRQQIERSHGFLFVELWNHYFLISQDGFEHIF